ncbi:hypothetical protein [Streptomyces sp. NPDC046727]|uniref:hypothetical protein n=1 Tax=Streptomyces sp. NPDC046727 TaxID=3155373 RepID=UPI0033EA8F38
MRAAQRLVPLLAAIGLAVGSALTGPPAYAAAPLLKSNLVSWSCNGARSQSWDF